MSATSRTTKVRKQHQQEDLLRVTEVDQHISEFTANGQRFQIVGYAEIPVDDIEPHPRNPRPAFHLTDDNPQLRELGDAIRVNGQTNPALVYEVTDPDGWHTGSYDPNAKGTGKYRLYQGERRWRSCRIANVATVRCFIARPPQSKAEELDWLGVEDSHKQPWQGYFDLKYAHDLAAEHGLKVASGEMVARTSLTLNDLKNAEKIFQLDTAIQAYLVRYEELQYESQVTGIRPKGTARLDPKGVKVTEFTVPKAAMVWDLFSALRENTPAVVREYSDYELQLILAQKASQSTLDDLGKLLGLIRQAGTKPTPGVLTELAELLTNKKRKVNETTKGTGVHESTKLTQFQQRAPKLRSLADHITKNVEQIGNDPEELKRAQAEALQLLVEVGDMERELRKRILVLGGN